MAAAVVADDAEQLRQRLHLRFSHLKRAAERVRQSRPSTCTLSRQPSASIIGIGMLSLFAFSIVKLVLQSRRRSSCAYCRTGEISQLSKALTGDGLT